MWNLGTLVNSSVSVQDRCGTCDANSTNDCVIDCAGTWGEYFRLCASCDSTGRAILLCTSASVWSTVPR